MMADSLPMPPEPLQRLSRISDEALCSDFIDRLEPVVIARGGAHWPALHRWTDTYLVSAAGDSDLRVRPHADYINGQSTRETELEERVTLSGALRRIQAEEPHELSYARESDLLSRSSQLRADVVAPALLAATQPHAPPRTGSADPKIWIGPAGTIAQLHWDPEHNLFVQVRGRKLVILMPYADASLAYPIQFTPGELARKPRFLNREQLLSKLAQAAQSSGGDATRYRSLLAQTLDQNDLAVLGDYLLDTNNCHVDAEAPDFATHPDFAQARRFYTVLEPGDLLFIPFYWHHYLRSLDPSISVNWFFLPRTTTAKHEGWITRILLGHLSPDAAF